MRSFQVKPMENIGKPELIKSNSSASWKLVMFCMKVGIVPLTFTEVKGFQFSICSWKLLSFSLLLLASYAIMDAPFYVYHPSVHVENVTNMFMNINVTDFLSMSVLSLMLAVGVLQPIQLSHCCSKLKFPYDSVNFKTVSFPKFGRTFILTFVLDVIGLFMQKTMTRQKKLEDLDSEVDQQILVYICHFIGISLQSFIMIMYGILFLILFEVLENYFHQHFNQPQNCLEYFHSFKNTFGHYLLVYYGLFQLVAIINVFLAITPFLNSSDLEISGNLIVTSIGYIISQISLILCLTGTTLTVENTFNALKLIPKKLRNNPQGNEISSLSL